MRGVAKEGATCRMYDDVEMVVWRRIQGPVMLGITVLCSSPVSGILTEGRTILGTSRQPFSGAYADENGRQGRSDSTHL